MKTKTLLFLFLFLLISGMMSAQVKRVAILETVDKEDKVEYAYELLLRRNLSKAITSISGYEAYDRTDIDAIMAEQSFQRTGLVSSDQIKRLGEMTGASYILVAEVAMAKSQVLIFAKLLDVETARTIMDDLETTTLDNIQGACEKLAKRMFHEEVKVEPIETNFELIRHTAQEQKMFGMKKYSYGNTQMDEEAFRKFLMNNNREVFLKYMKSKQLVDAGWGVFGAGIALAIAGGIFTYCDTYHTSKYHEIGDKLGRNEWDDPDYRRHNNLAHNCYVMWLTCYFTGGTAVLTSIPLLSVGYHRMNKVVIADFNTQQNTQKPEVTLNVTASQNGIGLALNF